MLEQALLEQVLLGSWTHADGVTSRLLGEIEGLLVNVMQAREAGPWAG
jgi:hypothetical protein